MKTINNNGKTFHHLEEIMYQPPRGYLEYAVEAMLFIQDNGSVYIFTKDRRIPQGSSIYTEDPYEKRLIEGCKTRLLANYNGNKLNIESIKKCQDSRFTMPLNINTKKL